MGYNIFKRSTLQLKIYIYTHTTPPPQQKKKKINWILVCNFQLFYCLISFAVMSKRVKVKQNYGLHLQWSIMKNLIPNYHRKKLRSCTIFQSQTVFDISVFCLYLTIFHNLGAGSPSRTPPTWLVALNHKTVD